MAYCGWPGGSGFAGVGGGWVWRGGGGLGFGGVDGGGVRGFVGCGAMWLGAALSFYGNFPDIS